MSKRLPRGIRNNNPGNIRHGAKWRGLAPEQTDKSFCQFIAPEWGIRAITRILRSYKRRGVDTVEAIINRWAPPVENDTDSYVAHVARKLGLRADQVVDEAKYPELIKALIRHENGSQPYSDKIIQKGISLA